MPDKIYDKFTDLPVSRQRKWQLRRKAKGMCINCGNQKAASAIYCVECMKKKL